MGPVLMIAPKCYIQRWTDTLYTYIKIDIEMDIWGEMEREGGRGKGLGGGQKAAGVIGM